MKAGSPIQCSMPHVPFETLGISVSCLDIDTAMPYCVRHLQLQADSVTYWFHSSMVLVWQGEIKTNFASQRDEATHKAVEKLFKFSPTNVQ